MLFNPLFNHDGSLSKFRLACMIVFAGCLAAYGTLQLTQSPADTAASAADSAVLTQPQKESQGALETESSAGVSDAEKAQQALAARRAAALEEMARSVRFYQDCGAVNQGYVGCHFTYSDGIKADYQIEDGANDDGFFITLKLKDAAAGNNVGSADKCTNFYYTSAGDFKITDPAGNVQDNCLPENSMRETLARLSAKPALRRTDAAVMTTGTGRGNAAVN